MYLKPGDAVEAKLASDEYVAGIIRSASYAGPFSENWTAGVEITEGGHPLFGRSLPFAFSELTYAGVTG